MQLINDKLKKIYLGVVAVVFFAAVLMVGNYVFAVNRSVNIKAPANGTTVSGSNVTISVDGASDAGINKVQLNINYPTVAAGIVGKVEPTNNPLNLSHDFIWDTTGYPNGSYTFVAFVFDDYGTANTTGVDFIVNNPVACNNACTSSGIKQCAAGANGYQTCGDHNGDGCLEWSAVTSCATGQTCSGGVCAAPACTPTCTASGAKQCASNTSYQTCDMNGGCLQWGAAVNCASGQTCSSGNCAADIAAPTVYISSPSSGATVSGSQNIEAHAVDNLAVDRVKFFIDGNLAPNGIVTVPVAAGNYAYIYRWDTTAYVNGNYDLLAKAMDAAGNIGSSSKTVVTVANATTSTPAICTSYNYGDWSQCSGGSRSKSITSRIPANCVLPATVTETITEECAMPCTYYTYGDWGACGADGKQTRVLLSKLPSGCSKDAIGSLKPEVQKSCAAPIECSFICTSWGNCGTNGRQKCLGFSPVTAGASCSNAPPSILTRACNDDPKATIITTPVPVCINYKYGDWEPCNTNGIQKRAIIERTPIGCVLPSGVLQTETRNCQGLICETFKYGDWEECGGSGNQTRPILSQSPQGCKDTSRAQVKRGCVYLPCKGYAYNKWSDCDATRKQFRQVTMAWPEGCSGGVLAVTERECIFCEYEYSEWGACRPNGLQYRKLVARRPEGCFPENLPIINQSCDYKPFKQSTQGGYEPTEAKVPCVYSYSAWSACVNKRQTRLLISKGSEGCFESTAPEMERACKDSITLLPALASDAPAPVPESMLAAATSSIDNFNGRTSNSWQKYYFGADDCRDAQVCGGDADPDNDNLGNNDEYRFGTNPKSPDTDRDGWVDADEIQNGRDPLSASSATSTDVALYENPKEVGLEMAQIYLVNEVLDYDPENQKLELSGRALPNSYVSIYVYSKQPVILTEKTDEAGNWVYVIDKPEDGRHEVYVVVNDKDGKVTAKSAPLPFVQTAEAATVTPLGREKVLAPAETRSAEGYFVVILAAIGGLFLGLAAIGLGVRKKRERNQE